MNSSTRLREDMSTSAIGIDLGTTNCCVAVWQGDGVEIISNDVGGRVTPSYVSFDDDERLIGAPAKAHGNEKNTCAPPFDLGLPSTA